MLPSSSGPGRQPPQAGNACSNHAGSAIQLCPCHGPLSCFGGSDTAKCRLDIPPRNTIQDDCKYGWVLPDRCRYTPRLGCDCGAYPPRLWNEEKGFYEPTKDDPRVFKHK